MENWPLALFILGIVVLAMIGQAWASLLEHRQRDQTIELIKAMLAAGKEPPTQLYEQLGAGQKSKAPWGEVLVFGVLSFGFWLAFFLTDSEQRTAFMVIAITMTATALGCLGLALFGPGRSSKPRDDDKR